MFLAFHTRSFFFSQDFQEKNYNKYYYYCRVSPRTEIIRVVSHNFVLFVPQLTFADVVAHLFLLAFPFDVSCNLVDGRVAF